MQRRSFLRLYPSASGSTDSISPADALKPYASSSAAPWDQRRAAHVLRRVGIGAPTDAIAQLLAQQPLDAIDGIITAAVNTSSSPEAPLWYTYPPPVDDYLSRDYQEHIAELNQNLIDVPSGREIARRWGADLFTAGLREKLVLFWHNHFVTQEQEHQIPWYAERYVRLLREHALGNFKAFVYEIGLDPSMLFFLDGRSNTKAHPNENFARELLELFTVGIGHYSQQDVEELARALTGWVTDPEALGARFVPERFDDGEKTIFGRTGAFGYDSAIDLIFEVHADAIARRICGKLYSFFVYAVPDAEVVEELAAILLDHEFELLPVLRALLRSEHFLGNRFMGAKIKSPVELMLGLTRDLQGNYGTHLVSVIGILIRRLPGQELLNPPNVAGWPEHRHWITTQLLSDRWALVKVWLEQYQRGNDLLNYDILALAREMSDPDDPYLLAQDFADHFLAVPLAEAQQRVLPEILLNGLPDYEWRINADGAADQLWSLVFHLVRLPEYQLT